MSVETSVERHSSIAQGWLLTGEKTHSLAQIASEFVILSRPETVANGKATLRLEIDGVPETHQLTINGTDPKDRQRLLVSWES
jgi:hypothetical protein